MASMGRDAPGHPNHSSENNLPDAAGPCTPEIPVECAQCHNSIAATVALNFEGAEYIYHFCGPQCCELWRTTMVGRVALTGQARDAEASRIRFLLARDGAVATRNWVRRTLAIYRSAVINRQHFAHSGSYRKEFLLSILVFRRWLTSNGGYGRADPREG